jgi:hypothetical protein
MGPAYTIQVDGTDKRPVAWFARLIAPVKRCVLPMNPSLPPDVFWVGTAWASAPVASPVVARTSAAGAKDGMKRSSFVSFQPCSSNCVG